jgi:protein-S-isoprenylcysteine O-methyltransferase Ste14
MWIGAGPGEPINAPLGKRLAVFAYGLVSYALFFATFLYAAGWVGNFLTPTSIDGSPTGPLWFAALVNVGLLGVFAVQHSVMARPAFKRWWTRIIPEPAERATYTLLSSVALILMFALWRPMGGVVWDIQNPFGRVIMYSAFAFGWLLILATTFLINHFDLFGLRQVWLYLRNRAYTHLKFATPGPYRFVRHPLYVGWLFAFWATPTMTAAHFLFALVTTAYILFAIQLEERDLINAHPEYEEYRQRVPMLVPTPGKMWEGEEVAAEMG